MAPGCQDQIQAIENLLQAFEGAVSQADLDTLSRLLCEDATAVFSGMPEPVRGRKDVLDVWKRHTAKWSDVRIFRRNTRIRARGDVAWGFFLWDGEGNAEGERYRLEGERMSVVLLARNGSWKLAHTHASMPYRDWDSHRIDR